MRHLAELDNLDCGVDDAEKSTKQEDIWAIGQISCGKERRENPRSMTLSNINGIESILNEYSTSKFWKTETKH
jgi:hypothetical protein